MFFLNLTAGEFLVLFGALGSLIAALYLLDRTRRKKVVSTLRFWTPGLGIEERHSRTRVREPWSLLLQLVGLLLLLLSLAELNLGTREHSGRDHVLLLDTSSWTGEIVHGGPLLDREKEIAQRYLSLLPSRDRVMLVRVDGLAIPVVAFTSDRRVLTNALLRSSSGFSALNIGQALSFARRAQASSGGLPGEIVYIGPRLIVDNETLAPQLPNLRVIALNPDREHCGIRHVGVKRNEEDADAWQATVTVKNYGSHSKRIRLETQFSGTRFAPRILTLEPDAETGVEYKFTTHTAGQLITEISGSDKLESDRRAVLELPQSGKLRLAVFTNRPDVIAPLLESDHRLGVKVYSPAAYTPNPAADVMLLDQFTPEDKPHIASLWIGPFMQRAPLPLKAVVNDRSVEAWHSETWLGAGLHARGSQIPTADVFQTFDGDLPVSSVAEGPIVVARPSTPRNPKLAAIGFDPLDGQLRFEITTPLLFANLLRWLSPEAARTSEILAAPVGAASLTLDASEHGPIQVADRSGAQLPFTVRDHALQLFTRRPSVVGITSGDHERILSLTLPDVAEFEWKPPRGAALGLPASAVSTPQPFDLWKLLAILGAVVLLAEWILFGCPRVPKPRKPPQKPHLFTAHERERELISK